MLFFATRIFRMREKRTFQLVGLVILITLPSLILFPNALVTVGNRLNRVTDLVMNAKEGKISNRENVQGNNDGPAMIYLTTHPWTTVTGVGIGCTPFYYEYLVPKSRVKGRYEEASSGIIKTVFSFGIIGIGLFLLAAMPLIPIRTRGHPMKDLVRDLYIAVFISLMPSFILSWIMIVIGFSAAPGVRMYPPDRDSQRKAPRIWSHNQITS